MYLLNDDQEVNIQIGLTDDVGNPATLPSGSTVTWGSSDSTTVSVTVNATDQTQAVISSVGPIGSTKLGTAQVNVSVQLPNNPDGSVPPAITGQFDVQVVGSAPTSVSFNPGTPTQRTTS